MFFSASCYCVVYLLSHNPPPSCACLLQHGGYSRTVVLRLLEKKYTSVVSLLPSDHHLPLDPLFIVIQQESLHLFIQWPRMNRWVYINTHGRSLQLSQSWKSHLKGCMDVTLTFKYRFFNPKRLFPTLTHCIRITEESTVTLFLNEMSIHVS